MSEAIKVFPVTINLTEKEMNRLNRSYAIESKPFLAETEKAAKEQKLSTSFVYCASLLKSAINDRFEDAQQRAIASVEKSIEVLKAQGMADAVVALEAQLASIKALVAAESNA